MIAVDLGDAEVENIKPFEGVISLESETFVHVRARVAHVLEVFYEAAIVVAVLAAVELALEIIIARGAFLIAAGLAAVLDDFLHPPLLRLGSGVHGGVAMAAAIIDAGGDVVALGLQHVGQVELERGLIAAHDEQIGIAMRVNAEQGADAVAVFILQIETVFATDAVVGAGLLHLEAGGVNQQVQLVLLALEQRPVGGDFSDAFASGVDQMHIGAVEGR